MMFSSWYTCITVVGQLCWPAMVDICAYWQIIIDLSTQRCRWTYAPKFKQIRFQELLFSVFFYTFSYNSKKRLFYVWMEYKRPNRIVHSPDISPHSSVLWNALNLLQIAATVDETRIENELKLQISVKIDWMMYENGSKSSSMRTQLKAYHKSNKRIKVAIRLMKFEHVIVPLSKIECIQNRLFFSTNKIHNCNLYRLNSEKKNFFLLERWKMKWK